MRQYVVDAFTHELFKGNPAAVCLPTEWPDESTMLSIAKENRLSETAFLVREPSGWHLRWFTPGGEIDLCGHATLASAFVLFETGRELGDAVTFDTMSGPLTVVRNGDGYRMQFPAYDLKEAAVTDEMESVLGARPSRAYIARDLICIFDEPGVVEGLSPDLEAMLELEGLLCHVSEPGSNGFDCVSRSFAPKLGVDEDPVCGSGHCHIAPYWFDLLNKDKIKAYQASSRGGELICEQVDDVIILEGEAVLFAESNLNLGK